MEIHPRLLICLTAENCEAPQKRRFLCRTRRKAQEYLESLSSILDAVRRKKIPFEAVYPYVNAPKRNRFFQGKNPFLNILAIIIFTPQIHYTTPRVIVKRGFDYSM